MSDKPEFELLVEISKLLKRYGPETFERLAEDLSSPEFSERLVSILSATARTARRTRTKGSETAEQTRASRGFRSSLIALEKTEPDKSALLVKFHDDLTAKTVLPSLRDIQTFLSDSGLSPLKATSRDKAIVPFLKALLPLPYDELRARLSTIRPVSTKDDRSLAGWSDIILDRGRRTKESN